MLIKFCSRKFNENFRDIPIKIVEKIILIKNFNKVLSKFIFSLIKINIKIKQFTQAAADVEIANPTCL